MKSQSLYFCHSGSQSPLPRGHLLGGFGENVYIPAEGQTWMHWPLLILNTDVLPELQKSPLQPWEKSQESHRHRACACWAIQWSKTLCLQPSCYWRKINFLFESLLLKFSIICNKMYSWQEHILCYHDKANALYSF